MDSVVPGKVITSEGGPFSLTCQGRTYTSTRILGAIYTVPIILDSVVIHGSLGQREVLSLWLPRKD